jgi:tRNA threonylcarbamoyladenosine biosynthesis protein TsaB
MSITTIASTTDLPVILVLDSAAPQVSIAVARGPQILAMAGFAGNERQSAQLLLEIDWLLARAGVTLNEVKALGVVVGPGGFTGLRVSLATIKGIAHARQLPVVGVSALTLAARAAGIAPLTAVIKDAHRQDVFLQIFTINNQLSSDNAVALLNSMTPVTEAVVLPAAAAIEHAQALQQTLNLASILFTGNGVPLYAELLAARAAQAGQPYQVVPLPVWGAAPGWTAYRGPEFLAGDLVALTLAALEQGNTLTAQELAAYYLRPADAEVKLQLGLTGKKQTG